MPATDILFVRMDDHIDSSEKATVFFTPDDNSAYQGVENHEQDQDDRAFTLHHGIYRFTIMSDQLKSAPRPSQ